MSDLELMHRIQACKVRLLENNVFFGLLMQHIIFAIDPQCPTACTDGERIYFGSDFCDKLDDDQLYFVLQHELMHIVLGHCFRGQDHDQEQYNIAADIVVNSIIMHASWGDQPMYIQGQPLMHLTPNREEGRRYTAEDVYDMLLQQGNPRGGKGKTSAQNGAAGGQKAGSEDELNSGKKNGRTGAKSGQNKGKGRSCPAENGGTTSGTDSGQYADGTDYERGWHDDHSVWGRNADNAALSSQWKARMADALRIASASNQWNDNDGMWQRLVDKLTHPTVNWRLLLNNFVQQDITDYSFAPPDRRYQDDLFLPDFNVPTDSVQDLWLVIDTSGSISDKALAAAYSEIVGAIEQFEGRLRGFLSFFDTKITTPVAFEEVKDVLAIRPKGGGGTDFHVVFQYYRQHMAEQRDCSGIVIFTDGYAPFPPQSAAQGTPVFWLVNNEIVTPPWGIVARFAL